MNLFGRIRKNLFLILLCICVAPPAISEQPSSEWKLPQIWETRNNYKLSDIETIYVRGFEIKGNTIFSKNELLKLTEPYKDRQISYEDLNKLRLSLTYYYTDRGYINSGAIIPDQKITDGIITIVIIEGRLSQINVHKTGRLRKSYIEKRLISEDFNKETAFNINNLQKRLLLLKENPLIDNIKASVSPGLTTGEAFLDIDVKEARPYNLSLEFSNYGSPSIGAYRLEGGFRHQNLTGNGDSFDFKYNFTEGLDYLSTDYTFPITAKDTEIGIKYSKSIAYIVSEPFNLLDIKSDTETYGIRISHPFYKNLYNELKIGLNLEKHINETFLLDIPFSFTSNEEDSKTQATVLSLVKSWISRSTGYVLSLNSQINFGTSWLDSTVHEGDYADSRYVYWAGQFQFFRKINSIDSSFLIKLNCQLSNDSLLSAEKFSIGGFSTVRGYRENIITADNGTVGSLEMRFPIIRLRSSEKGNIRDYARFEFCPFFDYGSGWDKQDSEKQNIYSVGAGLRLDSKYLKAQIYYGKALKEKEIIGDSDLQDDGIHFQIEILY